MLWETERLPRDTVRFRTKSGVLTAAPGADGWITLDFPAPGRCLGRHPAGHQRCARRQATAAATSRFDLLVELESEQAVCAT